MDFPITLKQKILWIASSIGLQATDVSERFTHGHGHGGQKLNKSSNCVELTHHPTGVSVRFQHHRGLHRNRVEAWELLVLKVEEKLRGDASQLSQARHKIEKQKRRRSQRSKQKMLRQKHERAAVKQLRKNVPPDEET